MSMSMKSKLAQVLLASALMGSGMNESPLSYQRRKQAEPNGNSRRLHKENVRRKRLRRLTKKAKQINRN